MGQRLDLQELLEDLLGSSNVYFQPPPGFMMAYPCIVYNRSNIFIRSADNLSYKHDKLYNVTVIDANPDSSIPDKVAQLPRCTFDRQFVSENLIHDVFRIIF